MGSTKKMGAILSCLGEFRAWILGYKAIQRHIEQHLEQHLDEIQEQIKEIQQDQKKILENQQTLLSRYNSAQKPQAEQKPTDHVAKAATGPICWQVLSPPAASTVHKQMIDALNSLLDRQHGLRLEPGSEGPCLLTVVNSSRLEADYKRDSQCFKVTANQRVILVILIPTRQVPPSFVPR